MAYSARVLLDSVSPTGVRLTTLEVTFPRFVLSEFNTHRAFLGIRRALGQFRRQSCSSASRPIRSLPLEWGRNKAGMSASEMLVGDEAEEAKRIWLHARDDAVAHARQLLELRVHKQELNRLLEPFLWHTVIVTATRVGKLLRAALRAERAAGDSRGCASRCARRSMPAVRARRARRMACAAGARRRASDLDIETRKRISAARCARVSYLTHDGKRENQKDLELYERLRADRHLSPFEHVATPAEDSEFHANFRGWLQMRREIDALSARPSQAPPAAPPKWAP